jgi:hypothetical protein
VVQELLRQASQAGVRPRYVLLDRGFWSVAVIRYLQRARYAFLMAVPCRGRTHGGAAGCWTWHRGRSGGCCCGCSTWRKPSWGCVINSIPNAQC